MTSQYGAGYKDTTAGQQALATMDRQASEGIYNQAQSGLTTLSGLYGNQSNVASNTAGNANAVYQNQIGNRLNAINGTSAAVINNSGSQFAGDIAFGQTLKDFAGMGMQAYGASQGGAKK